MRQGKDTSEHKKSTLVMIMAIVLPVAALVCDLLVNNSIVTGTAAMIAGLIASAIASAGYSTSRGRVKASENFAAGLLKKTDDGMD